LAHCLSFNRKLKVFHSAVVIFYSPSDISGVGGMHRQRICATPVWHRSGAPQFDCVFVEKDPTLPRMHGLLVAQVLLFFSFSYHDITYPCVLVQWFRPVGDQPCPNTGLWVVKPEVDRHHLRVQSVIHLHCILSAAHLIGVSDAHMVPQDLHYTHSLTSFKSFYVNKYANCHAHEIAF